MRVQPFAFLAGASAPAFTPASLLLTGWWRAGFAVPWAGVASAGSSGGRNMVTDGSDPTAGTTVNGFAPAHSDGSGKRLLVTGTTLGTLLPVGGYTLCVLCKPNSASSPAAALYLDATPVGESNDGDVGFAYNTNV